MALNSAIGPSLGQARVISARNATFGKSVDPIGIRDALYSMPAEAHESPPPYERTNNELKGRGSSAPCSFGTIKGVHHVARASFPLP
jgi:hypothetical protein